MKLSTETTVQFICTPEWVDAHEGNLIFLNDDGSLDMGRGYNMNICNIISHIGDYNYNVEFWDGSRHVVHGECLKKPNLDFFIHHEKSYFWRAERGSKSNRIALDCGAFLCGGSISATYKNPCISVYVNCNDIDSNTHFEDLLDECEVILGFRPMVVYGANKLKGRISCEDHPAFDL